MNTVNQCFSELKKALARILGAQYATITPDYKVDFEVREYIQILLRTMPYSDYHTLDLRDAYVLRSKTDLHFAQNIEKAIEGIRTYRELAELIHTLNQLLCRDESICKPEKTEHRLLNYREKYADMSEVKSLLDKTAPLKRTLQNLLEDIEQLNIETEMEAQHAVDLMMLLEKSAKVKSQLDELIEASKAKIQLIHFKQNYRNKFK